MSTTTADISFWPCNPFYNVPPCTQDRHRIGRIDTPLPYLQPLTRDQWWLQPIDTACRNSGVPPQNTPNNAPNSNWDAYDWHTRALACRVVRALEMPRPASIICSICITPTAPTPHTPPVATLGVVRHLINPDLSYTPAGCITLTGSFQNPNSPSNQIANIYDVGIGTIPGTSTNAIYILGSPDIWATTVDE